MVSWLVGFLFGWMLGWLVSKSFSKDFGALYVCDGWLRRKWVQTIFVNTPKTLTNDTTHLKGKLKNSSKNCAGGLEYHLLSKRYQTNRKSIEIYSDTLGYINVRSHFYFAICLLLYFVLNGSLGNGKYHIFQLGWLPNLEFF
jgi:hypothetical protein